MSLKILGVLIPLLLPLGSCMMHHMHDDMHSSQHMDEKNEIKEHQNHKRTEKENQEAPEPKTKKNERSKWWIAGGVGMAAMMILMMAL